MFLVIFFPVLRISNSYAAKRGDKLIAKWLLGFIKDSLNNKMFVHCYCASGVFLLSDNTEVTPIDVRFNGRILTINDQIFD